jgi:hypothetical protein
MSKLNQIESKRFVIRRSLIGQNTTINVVFKSGNTATYNHDEVYELMKEKLEAMNCFIKYNSYTSSSSIPVIARAIVETTKAIVVEAEVI